MLPVGLALIAVAPAWNMMALLVPNAAALLFPAWFRPQAPGTAPGIEMMGQQLLRFFGQFLALIVAMIPAAVAFGVVFGILRAVGSPLVLSVPLGGVAAGVVMGLEAAAGIWGLGRLFDRLDLSEE